jgi:membrane complex biogenesis BtpA family protein
MRAVIDRALHDVVAIESGGMDGAIIENFGDAPFHRDRVPASVVAAMAHACTEIRRAVKFPLGSNVLRNDVTSALAIAAACGLSFVRVNVHAGAMVTDQGVIEGKASDTLAERRRLGAEDIAILADVLVKHATPLAGTREALLPRMAEDTFRRGRADALIVSGAGTGKGTSLSDVETVRRAVPEAPVWVGSGATIKTARAILAACHGIIVGTWVKQDEMVDRPVDVARVRAFVEETKG